MTARAKTVRVYEVLADGEGEGPAADGTHVRRFREAAEAEAFAAGATCYGRPAKVQTSDVSRALAARWGLA